VILGFSLERPKLCWAFHVKDISDAGGIISTNNRSLLAGNGVKLLGYADKE
jgi:hypothetical protein